MVRSLLISVQVVGVGLFAICSAVTKTVNRERFIESDISIHLNYYYSIIDNILNKRNEKNYFQYY